MLSSRNSLHILLLLALTLSLGCSPDKDELETLAHVVVIGIDKGPNKMLEYSFQIANPQVGTSEKGQAENEPPHDLINFTAPNILSAKELANSVISRKLNFSHAQTIVISEEFARTGELHNFITASTGDPEMRRETNIIISKEKALDFINKNKPKLETRPHKYYQFMLERWRDTGLVPIATVNRYFHRLSGELFLAIYATTEKNEKQGREGDDYTAGQAPQKLGDPVQMIGSAVIKRGRMVGTLNGAETRLALLLRPKQIAHSFITTVPDPLKEEFRVSLRLLKERPTKIKINVDAEPAEVYVTIPLRVQILNIPSLTNYVLNLKKQEILKQAIAQDLEEKTQKLIKKTQQEFQAEPFNWYLPTRKQFWTWDEYKQYNWEEQYAEAKVEVNYDIEIEGFGKQFKPPQITE